MILIRVSAIDHTKQNVGKTLPFDWLLTEENEAIPYSG